VSDALAVDAQLKLHGFELDARFQAPLQGITALFGPSGAGKSLLLGVIAGLRRPDTGRITLGDRALEDTATGTRVAAYERGIGIVFQDARLFPHLDVRANLAYATSRALLSKGNLSVEEAAAHFDIGALLDRRTGKLSGGEKARVALARALLSAPDFLLLDEPFAALDGIRRAAFITTLRRMHETFAIPMLVVTHQVDDAVALADFIVGMQGGHTVASGPLRETAQQLPLRALFAPRDVGAALASRDLSSAASTAAKAVWVRADHVLLAIVEPTGLSARNIWPGVVEMLDHTPDTSILVRVATSSGPLLSRITPAAATELNVSPGQKVWAIVKAHSL
jgi:molybdate transport system ATP-binding protein